MTNFSRFTMKSSAFFPRFIFLAVAGLMLLIATNTDLYSNETGEWSAIGVKFFNFEYVSFSDDSDVVDIQLTSTPWSKVTVFKMGKDISVAKLYAWADSFWVHEYKVSSVGGLTLCDSYKIRYEKVLSEYYSPLLDKDDSKIGCRLYTDFGMYEIN